MRRLRKIKNLVTPATRLTDQVTDPDLRHTLTQWREALPRLP
jgi:hypothetical protein